MKLKDSIHSLLQTLYKGLQRYPATILSAFGMTVLFLVANHNDSYPAPPFMNDLIKSAMVFALGIPASLALYHWYQRKEKVSWKSQLIGFTTLIAILIAYRLFLLPDIKMVPMSRFLVIFGSLCLLFIFLPSFPSRRSLELYVVRLLSRLFSAILFTAILILGISAILFTINKLFSIEISGRFYTDVSILSSGLFLPVFFIAGIPSKPDKLSTQDYPRLLQLLLLYIVIPLLSIYTIILYLYFAKVALALQWPIQLLIHLVIWYLLLSIAVEFLTAPLHNETKWLPKFRFIFTKVLLLPLLVLFIAIGKRISQYSLTESRYFVVLIGLWIFGVLLYLNLSKKSNRNWLPFSLSIILLLSVFGPWSSFSLSKFTQNLRFDAILSSNKMLSQDNSIHPSSKLSDHDKRELSGILLYFNTYHSLADIKSLPKDFTTADTEKVLGFPFEDYAYRSPINGEVNTYFYYTTNVSDKPIDIRGYDYLFDFRDFGTKQTSSSEGLRVSFDIASAIIHIDKDNTELLQTSITSMLNVLNTKYGVGKTGTVNQQDMTLLQSNEKANVRLVFVNLNGNIESATGRPKLDSASFYLLLKLK